MFMSFNLLTSAFSNACHVVFNTVSAANSLRRKGEHNNVFTHSTPVAPRTSSSRSNWRVKSKTRLPAMVARNAQLQGCLEPAYLKFSVLMTALSSIHCTPIMFTGIHYILRSHARLDVCVNSKTHRESVSCTRRRLEIRAHHNKKNTTRSSAFLGHT